MRLPEVSCRRMRGRGTRTAGALLDARRAAVTAADGVAAAQTEPPAYARPEDATIVSDPDGPPAQTRPTGSHNAARTPTPASPWNARHSDSYFRRSWDTRAGDSPNRPAT